MEDEQSSLSTVSGEGVTELPVNVSLPDETLMGQMGGENPVEDSYVVEDGEEIMVEIVGSDVFVDGMKSMNKHNCVVSQEVEVKYSESVSVCEISTRDDETVDNNSANADRGSSELLNDPAEASVVGEIGGAEVDTDERGVKDEAIGDRVAGENIVTTDHLNGPVEALIEGETGVAKMVTEESAKSEGAENNSSIDQKIEISQVKVVDADADEPRENGEGVDTELSKQLLECQGTATIPELDTPAENICRSPNDAETHVINAEIGLDNLVEEYESPQSKEVEVSLQKIETEHDGIGMPENISLLANGIDGVADFSFSDNHHVNTSSVISGNTEMATTNDEINKSRESEEDSGKSHDGHTVENHTSETLLMDAKEETELYQEYHQEEQVDAETEQLTNQAVYSRKRKALEDPLTDGSDKRVNINAAKLSASTDQTSKASFKIGECILRVASQLTGEVVANGSPKINELSAESSVIDMLSQLQLVAQDPDKPHQFRDEISTFFSGFRSSIVANKRVRKKKGDKSVGGSAEEFEFDDANDSYWTDRIVQNHSEKQLPHNNNNVEGSPQLAVPLDGEKPAKSGRKPQSRKKRFFTGIPNASDEFEEKVKRMKQESSPAELILNFGERTCVPSEINLNKTFRRFGPLMESETEVDHDSGRARVIFKRGSDAEVAHNSSQKFNIFGQVLVNYQIGYSPLISVKISPFDRPQG